MRAIVPCSLGGESYSYYPMRSKCYRGLSPIFPILQAESSAHWLGKLRSTGHQRLIRSCDSRTAYIFIMDSTPQSELTTTTIKKLMRMSCVRNFVFSMLCLLASGQPIWGLTASSQNLELDVGRSDLYNGSLPSASVGVPAQNLAVPPNPFIFKATGYTAVYIIEGAGYIEVLSVMRLIGITRHLLRERRRAAGEEFTGPIPGGSVLEKMWDLGRYMTWEMHQSEPITEVLSYLHAEIALQGTVEVTAAYHGLARQYTFSLMESSSMQLVAMGSLSRPQDAVTD